MRRMGSVSIPFGRVSVFKGAHVVVPFSDPVPCGFHPLWAGLSFQRWLEVLIEYLRNKFPSPLGGSQFSKYDPRLGIVRVYGFPSPLGGSQFSKDTLRWRSYLQKLFEFPSPLGGSQFSKVQNAGAAAHPATISCFHPLWAGLSFQRLARVQIDRMASVASFHPLWAGLSFQRIAHAYCPFYDGLLFPSPLGGSQFSKTEPNSLWALDFSTFGFHPLWAGLSFQSRLSIASQWDAHCQVSIPFGRVSVFKGGVEVINWAARVAGFHPLWAGLSFQRNARRIGRKRMAKSGRFHPLWAGLSFQSL